MRLGSWLNSLQSKVTRNVHASDRRSRRRRQTPVAREIHELETRTLLAAVSWDGGGGDFNWSNAVNWSGDALPGASDDVTIDFGANDFSVVHGAGTDSIRSLTSSASLTVAGGELCVSANSTIAGDLALAATFGGFGDITVSGTFTWNNGTLQGVNGAGRLTANGGTLIAGAATLAGGFDYTNPQGNLATWTTGINVNVGGGSTFENAGTLDLQTDAGLGSEADGSAFINSGTLTKTGGNPDRNHFSGSLFHADEMLNTGAIDIQVGTFAWAGRPDEGDSCDLPAK